MTFLTLLLLALMVAGQGAQITVYQIQLRTDGSALRTAEHRHPIGEKDSADLFEQASKSLGSLAESYRSRLESVVKGVSSQLGRPMSVENLTVTAKVTETLTGSVGVIGLDFVWKGFAKLVDGKLEVGDVFIGGLVLLDGELLRFVFPEHLSVAEVSPKPDTIGARFVGWAGRKVFQDGEPRIVLAPSIPTQQGPLTGPSSSLERSPQFLDPWVLAAFGAAAAVIAIGAVALTRGKNKRSTAYASDDVGKVLEVIRRHGGAVTQSKIVKESGLSKSTVSTILKVLERERVVVRQKAGREKLVRLAR
jgi:uncharacterized membrane protein